jgi:hypothetical protein
MPPSPSEQRPAISPDDTLPPVEPPSAGFIVQLFVVPGVIVTVIVLVWLLFTWIARGADDPQQYLTSLERGGPSRWQAAANLADALRDGRHTEFRNNREAAAQLVALLDRELDRDADDGALDEKPITLRIFLCRALGEFQVDTGLEVLIKASGVQRNDEEIHVRRAAIAAIAVLADNLSKADPPQKLDTPELYEALGRLAEDEEDMIREAAAFTLGLVGGERSQSELQTLLRDPVPNVRYNAATALARSGRAESLPVLAEMLAADQTAALETEGDPARRPYKRLEIARSALRATRDLARANPAADLSSLTAAIEALAGSDLDGQIVVDAKETLHIMNSQ